MKPTVLSLQDITKAYPSGGSEFWALKGVSFEVTAGEMVALMGPSGSGKSTLMNILGILDRQTSGRYLLNGTDVTDLNEDTRAEARNHAIGFVFQAFHLLPRASLLENVEVPLTYAGVRPRARRERAMELLERVGLADKKSSTPSAISGGQKQRVAVARALAMSPALLLADEPTGNLDSTTGNEIMGLIHDLNAEGATILLVTHEHDIADQAARTIVLRDGRIESDTRQAPRLPVAMDRTVATRAP